MKPVSLNLKKFFLALLLSLLCPHGFSKNAGNINNSTFKIANPPGAIGECGSLYLIGEGIHANPFYNDVFGDTDKQLSGATQLGYVKSWRDSSAEIRTHWRFITPTFKEKFGKKELESPVGRYADWMEMQGSWSRLYTLSDLTFRLQPTLGIGQIGDHGAKQVHRRIHKMIGASLLGLDYDDQPTGRNITRGLEVGFVQKPNQYRLFEMESMISIGYFKTRFMDDIYLSQNQVVTLNPAFKLGLETRIIRQIHSEAFGGSELQWRFEASTGFRYDWYRPTLKYVSPYIRGDQVGQFFLDLIGIYYEI